MNQQQIDQENTNLGNQLYVLKTKFMENGSDSNNLMSSDEEKIQRIQKD